MLSNNHTSATLSKSPGHIVRLLYFEKKKNSCKNTTNCSNKNVQSPFDVCEWGPVFGVRLFGANSVYLMRITSSSNSAFQSCTKV